MAEQPPKATGQEASSLPRGPIKAAYALLACILLYVLIARWFLPLYLPGPIGVEQGPDASLPAPAGSTAAPLLDTRVNPNTATWSELTRLTGIGEVMAKRIVAYREEHRSSPGSPVFRSAEDLGRVKGIGAKTIAAIRDQLRFEDSPKPAAAPKSP
jgi:competence ComEA-like helix-hairpin-helix protein